MEQRRMPDMETLLVIGLGSMGKRRARLLKRARPQAALCGVDLSPARREEAEALGIRAYESLEAALAAKAPRAAFVCTAPVTHAAIIARRACVYRAEPGGRRLR